MNFVGKFDAKLRIDGSGSHPDAHHHVDSVSAHAPSDAIIVSDADLLFNGDFKQSGVDLILSRDDHELVVHDYFKGEKRAALASRDGAHLTGDIVNALAGHVQYAQADGSASAGQVIGHVTKLVGTATAIRNGVSIILNQGDNVEKGDVVQSGSGSTLGVTFIDGTVFGLSSNARMVLNEMVYDPNGSNNSSLISLVAGTISFVAGQTAKHGDMKIDTPVATMGIRGTAVLVEIDFDVPGQNGTPEAKFQVLVEPDGTTGSYILFDKNTLAPIAVVDKAGQQVDISNGNVSFTNSPLSPELQKLITDVFTLKFTNNTNPQTFTHFADTLIPQSFPLAPLPNGAIPTATILLVSPATLLSGTSAVTPAVGSPIPHINQPPVVTTFNGSITALTDKAGSSVIDSASGTISFADINLGDRPTAQATFTSFTFQNAQHQDITAKGLELADIQALEIPLLLVQTPGNTANGTATWTYNIPNTAVEFLAAGETLTLTYTAEVDSNYPSGNQASFVPFTVTIVGTDDLPTVKTTSAGFTAGHAAIDHAGGTIFFADVNLTDRPVVSTAFTSFTFTDASHHALTPSALQLADIAAVEVPLTLVQTGNTNNGSATWTYSLADGNFDFLAAGQILTLKYTASVDDGHGGTVTHPLTVTITGTNDTPVIVGETDPSPQTISLAKTPIVLGPGVNTNSLGLHTETFDTQTAGLASNNGSGYGDFFSSALGASFTGSGDAGVVNGSSAVSAAPFVGPFPGQPDITNYLSIGASASETITFASEQDIFGLYWGSVDSYNSINFYNGTQLVGSYTGANISPLFSSGSQGSFSSNGYVEFADLAPFNKVVLASAANAFEVDNISAGFVSHQLPSPISGTLTVSDAVIGDTLTASVIGNAVITYDGSTTLPVDANVTTLIDAAAVTFDSVTTDGGLDVLHWTYNPINPDLDFLHPGDTLTITFEAQVNNGHVTTGDQPLTVTFVGASAPVLTVPEGAQTIGVSEAARISGVHLSETGNTSGEIFTVTLTDSHGVLSASTVGDGDTVIASGTTLTITGSLSDVNSDLATLTDTNGTAGSDPITLTATDSFHDSAAPQTVAVTIQPAAVPATTLTFDNSSSSVEGPIPNGYGGLYWLNVDYLDSSTEVPISGSSHGITYLAHPDVTIVAGESFQIPSSSADSVQFSGSGGTFVLDNPSSFSGKIAGISGSGDILDLKGFDTHTTAATGSGSYDSANGTSSLTVTDPSQHLTVSISLVGDYSKSSWTVTDDGHGGVDIVDPPAEPSLATASGAVLAIASATSLEIASPVAAAESVTFHTSTGRLTLDTPSRFEGTISGFTGDGTLAGSDQIDLKGINHHSNSFIESYNSAADTLTVSDGTNAATLHFNGTYQAANFNFASDGDGGTIVYDPPVSDSPNSEPAVGRHGSRHGFVFKFASDGPVVADLQAADPHDGPAAANGPAFFGAPQSDGHGHMAGALEAHDPAAWAAILKAQLHASDFHF